jgi:hypothetical protein
VHPHEGADLRPLGRARRGEQRPDRRRRIGIDAELRRLRRQPRAFVEGNAGADLVFLDHGEIGIGGRLWAAHQRQHSGFPDLAKRHDTPEPEDQAIAALGPVPRPRWAPAGRAARSELRRAPPCRQRRRPCGRAPGGPSRPALERQALDQPPFLARLGQLAGHLGEGGMFRRFARDLRDGWARTRL